MNVATLIIIGGVILLGIGILVAVVSLRRTGDDSTQGTYTPPMSASAASISPSSTNLSPDILTQVQTLLSANRKIEAIKIVRAATNWGLKEAKDYVEALPPSGTPFEGISTIPSAAPQAQIPDTMLMQQAHALLSQGRKIDAIKKVREATGWGLKEAKDYIEASEISSGQIPVATPPYTSQQIPSQAKDISYLDYDIRDLLAQNKKVAAVKMVREATGWGLKESKNYVDNIQAQG
jgi:ribosomal protein L7/L12